MGIGHPYPETLELLERELPMLAAEGIELIGIGDYVALKDADKRLASAESAAATELATSH
jgi:polysaccharide deacetylase 2 family uncharacterized protein YibQ